MSAYMPATVFFHQRVEIESTVYQGEMENLEVAMEDRWLHVRVGTDGERVHSFPLPMIASVAWDRTEPTAPPFVAGRPR
ncbi:hypothetical protein P3T37_006102 [Kitasatospora sp. MAA4]|uniref:hypothetical protein n=1 Tax=Kitasatospora sp. MAA4 TaxID=3035093 RepID=UPI002473478F|nr:hypothetical protein [Kitasatospora sp. MAA4]MDH6136671.1 hypothetical protein [Kitasatospora sp. MAA4]